MTRGQRRRSGGSDEKSHARDHVALLYCLQLTDVRLVIRPGSPDTAMPGVIGSSKALLDPGVRGVHHGPGSEVKLAVRVGQEPLAEMILAEPVARFVQRYRLNVNVP